MKTQLGNSVYPTKAAAYKVLQTILQQTPEKGRVPDVYTPLLMDALGTHPWYEAVQGDGISHFEKHRSPEGGFKTCCFYAVRGDGSMEGFSYRNCKLRKAA